MNELDSIPGFRLWLTTKLISIFCSQYKSATQMLLIHHNGFQFNKTQTSSLMFLSETSFSGLSASSQRIFSASLQSALRSGSNF